MPCIGSKCHVLDFMFEEEYSRSNKAANSSKNSQQKFLKSE